MIMNSHTHKKKHPLLLQMLLPLSIVIITLCIGTIGYYILWLDNNGTVLDALYMTVITIATIGFGEVKPLSSAGRIFTIVITFIGMGGLIYLLTTLMEYLVQIQLSDTKEQKRMKTRLEQLHNHIILIGGGRVGKHAANELLRHNQEFILIDSDVRIREYADEHEILYHIGDATDDNILIKAGIERARGIIIATPNDATNLFIVLSARSLHPTIKIIARAEEESSVRKLLRAGADKAITPHTIGGQQLVTLMIHPTIVDFLENTIGSYDNGLRIESLTIAPGSPIIGHSLDDIYSQYKSTATVLVIIKDKQFFPNPEKYIRIEEGNHIIAFGTDEQLTLLEQLATIS